MSIIEQAKAELSAVNFGEEDSARMIEILELFFGQWDSGGAVSFAAPALQRLIAGKPLGPLTGADSEWLVHDCEGMYAQNIRCSTVFKATKDGPAYDIDVSGRPPITFPSAAYHLSILARSRRSWIASYRDRDPRANQVSSKVMETNHVREA